MTYPLIQYQDMQIGRHLGLKTEKNQPENLKILKATNSYRAKLLKLKQEICVMTKKNRTLGVIIKQIVNLGLQTKKRRMQE